MCTRRTSSRRPNDPEVTYGRLLRWCEKYQVNRWDHEQSQLAVSLDQSSWSQVASGVLGLAKDFGEKSEANQMEEDQYRDEYIAYDRVCVVCGNRSNSSRPAFI